MSFSISNRSPGNHIPLSPGGRITTGAIARAVIDRVGSPASPLNEVVIGRAGASALAAIIRVGLPAFPSNEANSGRVGAIARAIIVIGSITSTTF